LLSAIGVTLAVIFGAHAATVASDFDVYYRAGTQVLQGDARLYPDDVGGSTAVHYLRSAPIVAWLFAPLALLPFEIAAFVFYALKLAGLIAIVIIVSRMMNVPSTSRWRVAAGAFAATAGYIVEELRYGNAHLLVLFAIVMALYLGHRGRVLLPGALLALAIAVKLTPLLVVFYLAICGKVRVALTAIGFFLLLLLLPSAVYGPDTNVALVRAFGSSIVRIADQPRNHSLRGVTFRYLTDTRDGRSYPNVNVALLPRRQALAIWAVALAALAVVLLTTLRRSTRLEFEVPLKDALVVVAMLLFATHTQRIHLSWLFFPCLVLMSVVVTRPLTHYRSAIVRVLACAAIAGTLLPVVIPGRRLSVTYEMGSPYFFVTLALFFLIVWVIWRGDAAHQPPIPSM
jgi:Glycosyltransferase family 87